MRSHRTAASSTASRWRPTSGRPRRSASATRRGPPRTFSVRIVQSGPNTLETTIQDDAPCERRKQSLEVLEERARTLGAALSFEREDDDGTTMRLVLPLYAASEIGRASCRE